MVLFKITNGVETRRFQVTPGEITFQQLQERIATLFPEAAKEASNLTLRYRDSDGDVITLSSDEEFQEALSDLPSDHIWKLHIQAPPKAREEARPRPGASLLDHFLQFPFAARRSPWSEFDKQFKETQELVELLFGLNNTKPSAEEKTTSEENTKSSTSEESTTENETADDHKDTKPNEAESKEGKDEEVKSKHPKEGRDEEVKSKKSSGSECPAGPHCHVKRIHLWEPTLFGGLFGPRLCGLSVGYHITWTPRAQATAASSA